jgi:hypothetical protein
MKVQLNNIKIVAPSVIVLVLTIGLIGWSFNRGKSSQGLEGETDSGSSSKRSISQSVRTGAGVGVPSSNGFEEDILMSSDLIVAKQYFRGLSDSEQFEALKVIVERDPKQALAIAKTFSGNQKRSWILKVVEYTLESRGLSQAVSLLDSIGNGTTKTAIAHRLGESADSENLVAIGVALGKLVPGDRLSLLNTVSVFELGGIEKLGESAWFNELSANEKMPLLLQAAYMEGENSAGVILPEELMDKSEQLGEDNIRKMKEGFFSGALASSPQRALELLSGPEWVSLFPDKIHPVVAAMANENPNLALEAVVGIESQEHRILGVKALILDLFVSDAEVAADFAHNKLKGVEQKAAVNTIIAQLELRGRGDEARDWARLLE